MFLSFFCSKSVPVIAATATVREAAQLMRQRQSGYVVVVLETKNIKKPLGILTDRDIVIRGVCESDNLDDLSVENIMSRPLFTARSDDTVYQASVLMRVNGIGRLPIVDKTNNLVGVVEMDDVLKVINSELENLSSLTHNQLTNERRRRMSLLSNIYRVGT